MARMSVRLRPMLVMIAAAFGVLTWHALDAARALNVPADGDLIFEVYRNGDRFGTHAVSFRDAGDGLEVQTDIDLRVGLGPVTFFRYRHDAREIWRDGQLVSLVSDTLKDGRNLSLNVSSNGGEALVVEGESDARAAPLGSVPTSYWNIALIEQSEMLNTETGELMPIRVRELGEEEVRAGAETIRATRYRIDGGPIPLDILYDENERWVGLAFTARGSEVTYRLIDG